MKICGAVLWRSFLICGAAKDGCATNAPTGHILWRTPTVRSRFVAQFVAQHLWRSRAEAEARLPISPRATADA